MLSTIYQEHRKRRAELIKKLFEDIAKETIGAENIYKVKLTILYKNRNDCNWCMGYADGRFEIGIELPAIKKRTLKGYEDSYYPNRKLRIDKYIIHNRHNVLRFALYHELKHCADRLNHPEKETSEFDADGWAIKHLR